MTISALLASLAFSTASLIIGVRLLLLARTTRQVPELMVGMSFFFGGAIGHSLQLAAIVHPFESDIATYLWFFVSRLFIAIGCLANAVAAWRIFRPRTSWAPMLVGALIPLLVGYAFRDLMIGTLDRQAALSYPIYWTGVLVTTVSYGWMSVESLIRQSMLRRRWHHRLGGDPQLTSRILLWAIGSGAIALLFGSMPFLRLLGMFMEVGSLTRLVIAVLGLVCSASMWVAFFPPRIYLRRFERTRASKEAV